MEELKYVIEDSTIAELLGVQNFSTDEAAILELVKNAYDANALNLKITFQNDTLRFEDNGIGMNADDIKKHWMHIGKSSKEYEIIDENNKKRIQAGSKGVVKICFLECPALTSKFIVLLENSCPKINASIADMMIRRNVESYTIPLKISAREETISSVGPMTSVT